MQNNRSIQPAARAEGTLRSVIGLILIYCFLLTPLRGRLGEDSVWSPLLLLFIAAFLLRFSVRRGYYHALGISRRPRRAGRFLYFLPLWFLVTGNLWGGIHARYSGSALLFAVLSMLLVGLIEELLFRGLLFLAIREKTNDARALLVSVLSFGILHIVSLLAGQGWMNTLLQIVFALTLGTVFGLVYVKSGSLLPCILTHSLIDALSLFSAEDPTADRIYVGASLAVGIAYAVLLRRLTPALPETGHERDFPSADGSSEIGP